MQQWQKKYNVHIRHWISLYPKCFLVRGHFNLFLLRLLSYQYLILFLNLLIFLEMFLFSYIALLQEKESVHEATHERRLLHHLHLPLYRISRCKPRLRRTRMIRSRVISRKTPFFVGLALMDLGERWSLKVMYRYTWICFQILNICH